MNEYLEIFKKIKGDQYRPYTRKTRKNYIFRFDLCKKYSFAIPDEKALEIISRYSPIVEMGAGTGYWAYLLNEKGVDIICYDINPFNNDQANNKWFEIKKGTPKDLKKHPDRNLFLCWLDIFPEDEKCLKYFKGEYVIYIGEGPGGCCASDKFFKTLKKIFNKVLIYYEIPRWHGIYDFLQISRRK